MLQLKNRKCLKILQHTSWHLQSNRDIHVAVLGASGGIGEPLCLLLKQSPLISKLSMYDLATAKGKAVDISHIETSSCVKGYEGLEELPLSLDGAQIVVIAASKKSCKCSSVDDLFVENATIVRDLMKCVASNCPKALIAILTGPVNSMVPLASEIMDQYGCLDPARIFGVTTLDLVRANTFIGEMFSLDPLEINVPIIGGKCPCTVIPVLSQCAPKVEFDEKQVKCITTRIRNACDEVANAKQGSGTATMSTAYATARFLFALCRGICGEKNVVECSFVSNDCAETKYFSTPVLLGQNGVEANYGYCNLNEFECCLLRDAIPKLKKDIEKGENFVKDKKDKTCD